MERFVRLPFTGHPPEVIVDAVDRLAQAWDVAQNARTLRPSRSPLVA
jgi:hypothetical protein